MNPLKKIALSFVGSLKVLHSIRGRLRINVGGIKAHPEYAEKYAPLFLNALKKRVGITEVSLCKITGNLLVSYNPNETSEDAVMAWIRGAWNATIEIACSPDAAEADEKTLAKRIKHALDNLK